MHMGKALYRSYRPKSLSEVVGQEQITTTLTHAIKTGKISHAYLFTGPRGTGKTSIARILAHEINDLPYTDDSTHLDIIEIDAASNRRIDEIRDLRDKVNIAPTSAKYKVYIIDEVHMLTREAFNALLKTLEEPPAHAVFILATTEAHKLPETIVSRTQRFTFRPYPLEQVTAHLDSMAKKEKIEIDDEALKLIAAYGEGSFRDSISLLDQTRGHEGKVDADYVRSLIGLPTEEAIAELFAALESHDAVTTRKSLESLRDQGFGAANTAKYLGKYLRNQIVSGQTVSVADFTLLQKLLDVPSAHDADTFLELVLLEYALAPVTQAAPAPKAAPIVIATESPKASTPSKPIEKPKVEKPKPAKSEPPKAEKLQKTAEKPTEKLTEETPIPTKPRVIIAESDLWPKVLTALKSKHNTLYGVARMARTEITEDSVALYFKFAFHKKRLSESKNSTIITDILKNLTGHDVALQCEIETAETTDAKNNSTPDPSENATAASGENVVATVSNIFGGAELLES
jgi:DNA polymerase-3 subunit gamma/tau